MTRTGQVLEGLQYNSQVSYWQYVYNQRSACKHPWTRGSRRGAERGLLPNSSPPPFKAARDEMQVVTVLRAGQPSLVLHHCMQKSICKDMAKLYLKCLRHLGNLGYVAQLPFAVQCTYSEHF